MSKVWFITGATRGLGAEIAVAALGAGDRVVATGRNPARLALALGEDDERVLSLPLDVTDEIQAEHAVAAALDRFGRIDVLVNNAGYGQLGLFEENSADEIERQFATNLYGLMHVTRAILPSMRRLRTGHIFNLSSMGGMLGSAGASIYCATKFAIEGFSEALALELAPFGIKITIVEPGFFRTDFLDPRSARYGTRPVPELAEAGRAARAVYEAHNHRQAGDPARLGSAIVLLAGLPNPPLRYAAGSDAHMGITGKLDRLRAEYAEWQVLSDSTDIAAGSRAA